MMDPKKISPTVLGGYRATYAALRADGESEEEITKRMIGDSKIQSKKLGRPYTLEEFTADLASLGVKASSESRIVADLWRKNAYDLLDKFLSYVNGRMANPNDKSPETVAARNLAQHLKTGFNQKNGWPGGFIPIGVVAEDWEAYNRGEHIPVAECFFRAFGKSWGGKVKGKDDKHHQVGPNSFTTKITEATSFYLGKVYIAEPPQPKQEKKKRH